MIGRRQGNRPTPFAVAVDEPAPSERASAPDVTASAGWLPARQQRAPADVRSNATTESWLPAEIEVAVPLPAATSEAAVEWLPTAALRVAATADAEGTTATAALVPQQWLVEPSAAERVTDDPPPAQAQAVPTKSSADAAQLDATFTEQAAPQLPREAGNPLLRVVLPLVVVVVSLIVAFAIAGVFGSSSSRPAPTPSGADGRASAAAASPAAVRPAPATSARPARPRHAARHRAARRPRPQHAPSRSARAATPTPAPRPVAPVTVPRAPVPVAPAPAHTAPAAPQHTTPPRHISQTRPTQRSGGPGRQPTSG